MRRLMVLVAACVVVLAVSGVEGGQAQTPGATPVIPGQPGLYSNALGILPKGDPGKLAVIALGPITNDLAPVVVHNNTGGKRTDIIVTGDVRTANGTVTQAVNSSFLQPTMIPAGGYAIGVVVFTSPVAATDKITLNAQGRGADLMGLQSVNLDVRQFNVFRDRVTGLVANPEPQPTTLPAQLVLICLTEQGAPLLAATTYASEGVPAHGEVAFEFNLFGDTQGCPRYIMAASTP